MKYHSCGQWLLLAVLLLMLPMVFIACQPDTQEAGADKAIVEQVRPVLYSLFFRIKYPSSSRMAAHEIHQS
ncbi:MAG: hypothetical protein ACLFRF_02280 [Desulfobacterales bacterium]